MSTWSWSNGFGPVPLSGASPLTTLNGFAGPSIRPKKNSATE